MEQLPATILSKISQYLPNPLTLAMLSKTLLARMPKIRQLMGILYNGTTYRGEKYVFGGEFATLSVAPDTVIRKCRAQTIMYNGNVKMYNCQARYIYTLEEAKANVIIRDCEADEIEFGIGNTVITNCEVRRVCGASQAKFSANIIEITNNNIDTIIVSFPYSNYKHINLGYNEAKYIKCRADFANVLNLSGNSIKSKFKVRCKCNILVVEEYYDIGNSSILRQVKYVRSSGGNYYDGTVNRSLVGLSTYNDVLNKYPHLL